MAIKGFKITDNSRQKLFGVASSSLNQLIRKGCQKLQVSEKGVSAFLPDGTIIDEEYFPTLPPQSVVILSTTYIKTGADLIYEVLRCTNIDVLRAGEAVDQFFQSNIKEKIHVLSQMVNREEEEDFAQWAQGVETCCRTKEAFMQTRCRERIRGYFHSTAKSLRSSEVYSGHKARVEKLVRELKSLLTQNRFQGAYFDRTDREGMCDKSGLFVCGGLWNKNKCRHNGGEGHMINPYLTREQRIIFSTWNLDHRIEKSRTIIPSVVKAFLISNDENPLDSNYLYRLLFTHENLKLVHIVCHDKSAHTEAKIDPRRIIVRQKMTV